MADTTNLTYADLSDDEDIAAGQDLTLDDFDDLPLKDTLCKSLCSEFVATPKVLSSRQSVSHNREHMKVYLRVRPFTDNEVDRGESQGTITIDPPSCLFMNAPKDSFAFKSSQRGFGDMSHKFTFTSIFGEDTSQKTLFDNTLLGVVKDFVDGQNCLVFTYGVTNAGKTYTIQGTPQDGGILPRALDVVFNSIEGREYKSYRLKPRQFCDVFRLTDKQMLKEEELKKKVLDMAESDAPKQHDTTSDSIADSDTSKTSHYSTATEESVLETTQDSEGLPNVLEDIRSRIPDDTSVDVEAQGPIKFSIWVSFAEIYNEYIYDLLEAIPKGKKARRQPLKLSSDKNGSVFIKGLKEIHVDTADEAYRVLKIGQKNRSIASTKLNQCSSRSHCIFSIKILRVVDVDDPHVARVSKLSFCDLAGSERYTRTHNTGERLKEAGNINTSLLTLGKCISTLRYNQNHPKTHPKIIPFRESKLTRLFQSFFLGKGKANMIVNINQCASGFDETMHVLKFSAIAKQVTTVTSKLDNKWKAVPKKALPSARTISLVINQSGTNRDGRPSIAWATPGTAKAVAEELGEELDEIDESVLETDEEIDDDDEMTPITVKRAEADKQTVTKLRQLVEVLKKELIDEKHKNFNMEAELREEICQEMAEQIVEIEEDYNERLKEEQEFAEEKFDRKLELYTKSVKKANKRKRKEEDDDDEYVSSSLLAAEQVRCQQRDAKIEDLEGIIEKLKSDSEKDEEKMMSQNQALLELQSLVEANKTALEEANKRLCDKEALLQQSRAEIQSFRDTNIEHAIKMDEINDKLENIEAVSAELSILCDTLKQQLTDKEQVIEGYAAALKEKSVLISELQSTRSQALEHDDDVKLLNGELTRKVTEAESSLAQQVSLLEDKDLEIKELKDAVEGAAKQESEFAIVMQELEKKVLQAESARSKDAAMFEEKEAEIARLSKELTYLRKSLKEAQSGDETATFEAHEQKIKLEHLEESLKKAEKTSSDLKQKLAASGEEQSAERTQLQAHVAYVEEQLTISKTEAETLESQLERLKKEGTSQLKSLSSQLASTKEAHDEALSSKNKAEELHNGLRLEIEQLGTELNLLKEKLALNSEERESEMTELYGEISKTNSNLTTVQQESAAKVEALNEEIQNLRVELEKSRKSVTTEKSEIESLRSQIEGLQGKLQKATEATASTKNKMEKLKLKYQYHEEDAKEQDVVLDIRKKQVAYIEAELAKEKTATAELTGKIKELEDNLAGLQKTVNTEKSEIESLKSQIEGLQGKLQKATEATASTKNKMEKLKLKYQYHEEDAKERDIQLEIRKNQVAYLEAELAKEKTATAELTGKIKELEDNLAGLQKAFDDTNQTGQHASARIKGLEDDLKKAKDEIGEEQKAHRTSKDAAANFEARISEMRMSLEMSERTATSMARQIKRTKELDAELETTKTALAEMTDEVTKLKTVTGGSSEMKTKLEQLEGRLQTSEQQRQVAQQTLQETLSKCSSLEQSLEAKKDSVRDQQGKVERREEDLEAKRSEVNKLQESQTQHLSDIKRLEDSNGRLEQDLASKTSTINMLMKKMEQKAHEVKTAQQQVKSTEGALDALKSALQEQEEAMTEQDKLLNSKEEDYKSLADELETLQEKYDTLMQTSAEDQKTLRKAQRDLSKANDDIETSEKNQGVTDNAQKKVEELTKELKTLRGALEETNAEVRDLEKELGETRGELTTRKDELEKGQSEFERSQLELEKTQEQCEKNQKELKERRREVSTLREEMERVGTSNDEAKEMRKDQEEKDEKITKLETKLEEQEKTKEQELAKWRKDRDNLVSALEKEMRSLQEREQQAAEAVQDKDAYIEQLKKEMQERMSQSAAFTEDDESEDQDPLKTKRASRKSTRTSSARKSKHTSQAEFVEVQDEYTSTDASEPVAPVRAKGRRGRQTIAAIQEEAVVKEEAVSEETVPVQTDEIEEEPIYEEPPSFYAGNYKSGTSTTTSSSDDNRRQPSMVILDQDETDTSRVEMEVTPLQKTSRKTRNNRRGKKRKSVEMLEDEVDTTGKKQSTKSTRGRRRTRAAAAAKDEIYEETENRPASFAADAPLPQPGRRKALSKIGDMLHNSPFGKSAKKLVDNMQSPKISPPRTVEVAAAGAEGPKRRRKLYKTEISTPYECSPYESLSQQVEGTKAEDPPRSVEASKKVDNSHNIVTRKLRSRQKKTYL